MAMNTDSPLESLKIRDLTYILKHIRLGKEHLNQYLTPQEFSDLLEFGSLKDAQAKNLVSDKQEKTGNIVLIINTIATSFIGGWLGFAGFGGLSLHSMTTIIVILITLLMGGFVGYLSYQLTARQAREAIITQKLRNVEVEVISAILSKRQAIISSKEDGIRSVIAELTGDKIQLQKHDEYTSYLRVGSDAPLKDIVLSHVDRLNNKIFRDFYTQSIQRIFKSIERVAARIWRVNHPDDSLNIKKTSSYNAIDLLVNTSLTNAAYLKILAKPDLPAKKVLPKAQAWLRKNILGVAVGLLPTVLGGFSSLFVFLDGVPTIFKEFNMSTGVNDEQVFYAKSVAFLVACFITIYFGYSHIHTNYKAFKRAKQIELTEKSLAEKAAVMAKQTNIYHLVLKLKYRLGYLIIIRQAMRLLEQAELYSAKQDQLAGSHLEQTDQ